ncbi:hypothetical protein H920_06525 [Fukomys damarensis]|uniref:Uncharacterized protein n=1 Tax=Fukomys damarensis TaxID=885580 RepID=A0A091DLV2_FUKDA|nr:hypothetical protein H920_06525 [Fukomys damarensis]
MLLLRIRDSLKRRAAIPSDDKDWSSSTEKSQVHIRKTICSKLLLENQQPHNLPLPFCFYAIGNNLQNDVFQKHKAGSSHFLLKEEAWEDISDNIPTEIDPKQAG